MTNRKRAIYSKRLDLIRSSREAALAAIQIYNNQLSDLLPPEIVARGIESLFMISSPSYLG